MRQLWRNRLLRCCVRQYATAARSPALIRDTWRPVIGLEVHAQISSASKLFSPVSTRYAAPPNTQVGAFESAHPGTLPALNKRCVEAAIQTALALGATVNKTSWFQRKHYFYPDLPAGYQITQLDHPIASNGRLEFIVYNPAVHRQPYRHAVDLVQIQLEEDSGKSIHDKDNHRVLVDLNRAGQPLMELVFAPGLHDGEEAAAMVKELTLILLTLGTCNCRMEEGSLRVDANVSVHRPGEPLGTRTEVKNLNSMRSLVKAVDFEIERQIGILEGGGTVVNETRGFDAALKETVAMRDKEVVQDYRFMYEPNLPPLRVYDSSEPGRGRDGAVDVHAVRQRMPTLPEQTRQNLVNQYGLSLENAMILVSNPDLLNFFLSVLSGGREPRLVVNLLLNTLLGILNKENIEFTERAISPAVFGEVVDLVQGGAILHDAAHPVLALVCCGDARTPAQIVEANNWLKIPDDEIEDIVDTVLKDNSKLVGKYKSNPKKRKKMFNAIMGAMRAAAEGRVDMNLVDHAVRRRLQEH